MNVTPVTTDIFKEREDLVAFIVRHVPALEERSVLAVTSKIVALAEGRTAAAGTELEKEEIIRSESELAIPTKYVWLTVKDGMVMASAGIDESNAEGGKLILLPHDSFAAAERLRDALRERYGVRELGVLITDSRTVPLRAGVTGVALGYAGFAGIKDYRNEKDIFGRPFKFSRTDVADGLAAAAVLVMGEGAERRPLAVMADTPAAFQDTVDRDELRIDPKEDMYRPLFSAIPEQGAD